jgi:mono/diheme cytochrome c family protein
MKTASEKQAMSEAGKFVNSKRRDDNWRLKITKIFVLSLFAAAVLTVSACLQNAVNTRADEQISSQPKFVNENKAATIETTPSPQIAEKPEPPKVYLSICAECHGDKGEGTKKYPELKGVTTREEEPLSDENLLAIINDAKSMGLDPKMPSFKNKLSEEEKHEIIRWLKTLK